MITISNLNKDYGNDRGIFDLSFTIKEGQVFGYLGPNGAGKTTTIRVLLGFIKASKGQALINGLNCWTQAAQIHRQVGYLPGEISFLEDSTGSGILALAAKIYACNCRDRVNKLVERFQFDPNTPTRKMSKGMKQKLGIVLAFMHDPSVYILDEPTSGLDPLMQKVFIELLLEEKQRGKTILISSHIFQEIERTADMVGIIKAGRLLAIEEVAKLREMQKRVYEVTLHNSKDAKELLSSQLKVVGQKANRVEVEIHGDTNNLIRALAKLNVVSLDMHHLDLEDVFLHYYSKESKPNKHTY